MVMGGEKIEAPTEVNDDSGIPLVFISYSHDSPEHKRWVAALAAELRTNGIEVLLDQWDLRLGDDVPKFMERSVRASDRVLVVCTPPYIRKFNDGIGGVGYESVVVTGELIRDLGTAKFIPIIREKKTDAFLPDALGTRLYIDFTEEANRGAALQELLRELHNVPTVHKPPLGANPFALTHDGREAGSSRVMSLTGEKQGEHSSISGVYQRARNIALQDDQRAWRQLVTDAKGEARRLRSEWAERFLSKGPPQDERLRMGETLQGVETFGQLMAIALAGVESGRERYTGQFSLVEDILNPEDWVHGGLSIRVEMPDAAAYIFQALHGAMCLRTGQVPIAIRFLRTSIYRRDRGEGLPFWRIQELIGWPGPLDGNSHVAWRALLRIEEEWAWIGEVFGSKQEFREALTSYYLLLSLNEFAVTLKERGVDFLIPGKALLETPTHYAATSDAIGRRAYRLLVQNPGLVRKVWRSLDIEDALAVEGWPKWLAVGEFWHKKEYPLYRGYLHFAESLVSEVAEHCRLQEG